MQLCAHCLKEIRGKMFVRVPPNISIALGADWIECLHPKCHIAREIDAAKNLYPENDKRIELAKKEALEAIAA